MAEPEQLALFEPPGSRTRRYRRSLADNAAKRARGRLLVAGGLVLDRAGRVLLLHRSAGPLTWWETPGGKVDLGEAPREAAVREFGEELGVVASVVDDLGWHDMESVSLPIRYALYLMRIDEGRPVPLESHRFDQVAFFSWREVFAMRQNLSPNARNLAEMWLKGRLSEVVATHSSNDRDADSFAITSSQERGTNEDSDTEPIQLSLDTCIDIAVEGRLCVYVSTSAGVPADRTRRGSETGAEELG